MIQQTTHEGRHGSELKQQCEELSEVECSQPSWDSAGQLETFAPTYLCECARVPEKQQWDIHSLTSARNCFLGRSQPERPECSGSTGYVYAICLAPLKVPQGNLSISLGTHQAQE